MGKLKRFDLYTRFRESYPEYQMDTSVKEVETTDNYRIMLTLIRNQAGAELIGTVSL